MTTQRIQRDARLAEAGLSGRLVAGRECYVGCYGLHGHEIEAGGRIVWRDPRATLEEAQARLAGLTAKEVRS